MHVGRPPLLPPHLSPLDEDAARWWWWWRLEGGVVVRGWGDANARRSHSDDCGLCRKRRFVGETWSRLTATDLLDNSGPNGFPVLNYAAAEDI